MQPEDVPTIEDILEDYGISWHIGFEQYNELLDRLRDRENMMVTEIAPHFIYKNGMNAIIDQV